MKDSNKPIDLTFVLGIRPDVIRASLILEMLSKHSQINMRFVWSGQHYSENLKDVFFQELNIPEPDVTFEASGDNDIEVVTKIMNQLFEDLVQFPPRCVMFLGDTNTVLSSIVAAQLNIPIIHIEGCMRSYDWRMPEEKYRTIIDNLSDVIYTYFPEYKLQGVLEGLAPSRIVVIQNLIVDVLQKHYFPKIQEFRKLAKSYLLESNIEGNYFLATSHRRENVESPEMLQSIIDLLKHLELPVIFPASYRTQKNLVKFEIKLPSNVLMVDPIGYKLMLALMTESNAVITDSGTVVEETAIIGVPSVQMRRATERPQTYDIRSSVKFEPGLDSPDSVVRKLKSILNTNWQHSLGDGMASRRVVEDLEGRLYATNEFNISTHAPFQYHLPIDRSYRGDGIEG